MYPEIEAFTQWLHRKSPQASTPRHYQSDLNFFFTWAGAAPDQISVRKVDEFVVYCQTCGSLCDYNGETTPPHNLVLKGGGEKVCLRKRTVR